MSELSPIAQIQLESIRRMVGHHLAAIKKELPDDYKVTFVARHSKISDAAIVVTEEKDEDMGLVAMDMGLAGRRTQ